MNELKLYIKGENPKSINPYTYNSELELWIMGCLYQGVKMYDENLNLKNRLLKTIIRENNELVLKFKNIMWLDGSYITSYDYKFSIELLTSKYSSWNLDKFYNRVVGYKEYKNGLKENIEGIEPLNDYECRIKFDDDDYYFDKSLIIPIIQKKYYEKYSAKEFFNNCIDIPKISCGPYLLDKVQKDKVILKSNKNFHLGEPKIKKLIIYYGDENNQKRMLNEKSVNFSVIDPKLIPKFSNDYDIYSINMLKTIILEINNDNILKCIKIRKFIDCFLPRDEIINELYNGEAVKLNQNYPEALCELYNIKSYQHKENIEIISNLKLEFAYINDRHLSILKIIKKIFSKFNNVVIIKKYKTYSQAKVNSDFIIVDVEHQIFHRSSTYLERLIDRYFLYNKNEDFLSLYNRIISSKVTDDDIVNYSNCIRENVPFISILSEKEIQVISKNIKGIKFDKRGILANIQELEVTK